MGGKITKVWYDCGACSGEGIVENPRNKDMPPVECPSCKGKGGRWIDAVVEEDKK